MMMQGNLRVGRFNSFEARLACDSFEDEILISGRVAMNRALDGDVVAVELLPEASHLRTTQPCERIRCCY